MTNLPNTSNPLSELGSDPTRIVRGVIAPKMDQAFTPGREVDGIHCTQYFPFHASKEKKREGGKLDSHGLPLHTMEPQIAIVIKEVDALRLTPAYSATDSQSRQKAEDKIAAAHPISIAVDRKYFNRGATFFVKDGIPPEWKNYLAKSLGISEAELNDKVRTLFLQAHDIGSAIRGGHIDLAMASTSDKSPVPNVKLNLVQTSEGMVTPKNTSREQDQWQLAAQRSAAANYIDKMPMPWNVPNGSKPNTKTDGLIGPIQQQLGQLQRLR